MRPSTRLAAVLVLAAAGWTSRAAAHPTYYTAECSACHGATTQTCNGCHAHGAHSSAAKTDINLAAALGGTTFGPGDALTVTVTGGYRTGWLRVVLLDENLQELARSTCGTGAAGPPQGCTTSQYPITLSHAAPSAAGAHTWAVAWYGNKRDAGGASFGDGTTGTLTSGSWTDDPNNAGHGWQVVGLSSFNVSGGTVTTTSTPPAAPSTPTASPTAPSTSSASSGGCSTGEGSVTAATLLMLAAISAARAAGSSGRSRR